MLFNYSRCNELCHWFTYLKVHVDSSGMRVATDFLKGRIVEANLADLNKDEDQNYRKIRLQLLV